MDKWDHCLLFEYKKHFLRSPVSQLNHHQCLAFSSVWSSFICEIQVGTIMIIFYFPDGEIEVPKTLLDKPRAWKVSAWQSQGQDQISNTPPRFFVDPSPSQCSYSPTIIWFQTLRSHKRGGLELSSGCGQEWQLPLTFYHPRQRNRGPVTVFLQHLGHSAALGQP